jgi:hypothetical protein
LTVRDVGQRSDGRHKPEQKMKWAIQPFIVVGEDETIEAVTIFAVETMVINPGSHCCPAAAW